MQQLDRGGSLENLLNIDSRSGALLILGHWLGVLLLNDDLSQVVDGIHLLKCLDRHFRHLLQRVGERIRGLEERIQVFRGH